MVLSSGNFQRSFAPPGTLRALIIARKPLLSPFHYRVTGFTPRLWSLAKKVQWSTKSKAFRSPQSSSHSPHRRNCRWSLAISAKVVDEPGMTPYWYVSIDERNVGFEDCNLEDSRLPLGCQKRYKFYGSAYDAFIEI